MNGYATAGMPDKMKKDTIQLWKNHIEIRMKDDVDEILEYYEMFEGLPSEIQSMLFGSKKHFEIYDLLTENTQKMFDDMFTDMMPGADGDNLWD